MSVLAVASSTVAGTTMRTPTRRVTTPPDVSVLMPVKARTGQAQDEDCATT